jgi:hypothetical protein
MLRNREDIDPPPARLMVLANSFFPHTIRAWNELDRAIKNLPSVMAFKASYARLLPKRNALYYYGGRLESTIHARMRISNSPLKADLCNTLHVIASPLCHCGTGDVEDVKHFFFKCQLFEEERAVMVDDLLPFVINNVDYLLFGVPNTDHLDNIHVFNAVHKYIRNTKRFY